MEAYKSYEYFLWKRQGELAQKRGGAYGGMDFIMLYCLLQCVRKGLSPDMDVYDAVAWSSVQPLSVKSVSQGDAPVGIPDFTKGHGSNAPSLRSLLRPISVYPRSEDVADRHGPDRGAGTTFMQAS